MREHIAVKGSNKYKEILISGIAYKLIKEDKNQGFLNLAFQEKRIINLADKYIRHLLEDVINKEIVSSKSKIRIGKSDLPILNEELKNLNIEVVWK